MPQVQLRFYEELNDFLPPERRKTTFTHEFTRRASVKDLIESFGVPHTEVEVILVNGDSVNFRIWSFRYAKFSCAPARAREPFPTPNRVNTVEAH